MLDAAGVEHLVAASWHQLECLNVKNSKMTSEVAAQLSNADCPSFHVFTRGTEMDAAAISHFSQGAVAQAAAH